MVEKSVWSPDLGRVPLVRCMLAAGSLSGLPPEPAA